MGGIRRVRIVEAAAALLLLLAAMLALSSGGAEAATPGGTAVAGASDGKLYTSTDDGQTWSTPLTPFAGDTYALARGDDTFVVGYGVSGCGNTATSADGITWTLHDEPTMCFWDMQHHAGTFVAAGAYTSGTAFVSTSPDGVTWTEKMTFTTTTAISLAYGNGVWLATTNGTTMGARSTDNGVTWTTVSMPCACSYAFFAGDRFFLDDGTSTFRWSSNASAWTTAPSQPAPYVYEGTKLGSLYVFATSTGIWTTTDLFTYAQRTSGSVRSIATATDGTLLVAGSTGVSSSVDGIAWTSRLSSGTLDAVVTGPASTPPPSTTTTTVPSSTTTTTTATVDPAEGPCRWEWGGLQEPDPQPCPDDGQAMSLTGATRDDDRPIGGADLLALAVLFVVGSAVLRTAARRRE
jgi:hypothetical protein